MAYAGQFLLENLLPGLRGNTIGSNLTMDFSGATLTMPSLSAGQTVLSSTATTAGGATTPALSIGTAGVGIYFGSGAPTISAAQGSLYLRTDGSSTSTRLYVNTNGSTTWTNVTTAA